MTPTTEQELAEAIKSAKGPLRITGGGTRDIGHPVVGEALSTSAMSGITLYEPGALTLVAQAGTPVADIEAALDKENQRLAFEPMDHRTLLGTSGAPTIGGIVSGNVSGSRRIAVGACRDHALGVRFVDGQGTITKNGGRVMKNVTGYDLVKLLTGAYGTLGVLSEVSLKVLPKPETQVTLSLHIIGVDRGVDAMSVALGSPYEVTGSALDVNGTAHIRLEGFEDSVRYRTGKMADLLGQFGAVETMSDPTSSAACWTDIRDVTALRDHAAVVRVSIQPAKLSDLVYAASNMFTAQDRGRGAFDVMADWGGGLVWIGATEDQLIRCAAVDNGDDPVVGARLLTDFLQSYCSAKGGHATLVKGSGPMRTAGHVFQPENPTVTALSQGLRAKFDPRSILNPGLMG